MEEIRCLVDGARIAHWTPGRIRVSFSDAIDAKQFASAVGSLSGVISAKANPLTGSVLIHYRVEVEDVAAVLKQFKPSPTTYQDLRSNRLPDDFQVLRGVEAGDAIHRLLQFIGAILTGDIVGIVSWLLLAFFDIKSAPAYPSRAYLQAA